MARQARQSIAKEVNPLEGLQEVKEKRRKQKAAGELMGGSAWQVERALVKQGKVFHPSTDLH